VFLIVPTFPEPVMVYSAIFDSVGQMTDRFPWVYHYYYSYYYYYLPLYLLPLQDFRWVVGWPCTLSADLGNLLLVSSLRAVSSRVIQKCEEEESPFDDEEKEEEYNLISALSPVLAFSPT